MSIKQILPKNLAMDRNIHSVTQAKVQQEQLQIDSSTIPDIVVFLTPASLLCSWIIFFLILQKIRNFIDEKMVFAVKGLEQVPCKNCKFYANNSYLKCAVKPSIVLTEEAKNCSEYSHKKS